MISFAEGLFYGYKTIKNASGITYWDITTEMYSKITESESRILSDRVKKRLKKIRRANDENRKTSDG